MATMSGRDALMEILRHEGVEYVFGLPGATEIMFMDALEKQKEIKFVHCLHENVIIGAAEGYARTSGKAGVVNLHTGCGVAAAMGLLFNAHRGGVPLVITVGQTDSNRLLHDPHLSGEMVKTASPLIKWGAEVLYAADIPVVMQRAFKIAHQPPAGPVLVSLPQDILTKDLDFQYTPGMPLLTCLRPDAEAVNRAAELLLKGRNPAILVENGVARNGAMSEVVRLAELTGARVYQQWMSDVNFPNQHPLYMGEISTDNPSSREILEPFDVLVVIGCQLFGQDKYVPEPLAAKIIQIDDNPWEIAKNFPVKVGIQGDIKVAVAEVAELLEQHMPAPARDAAKARVNDITRETSGIRAAYLEQAEAERHGEVITDGSLMLELRDALKPGTLIVDDCWTSSTILRRILDLGEPGCFQRCRNGGSIGWGIPGAIGVQLAAPDRPVVAVCGDGSTAWSMHGLWTAAHYNLPITYVITHNTIYGMVQKNWVRMLGGKLSDRHVGVNMDEPVISYSQLAEAMGVPAQRVDRPGELRQALKSALESGGPSLVEVCLGPKPA
ncbi:thiamine pyrophosphate-binding protein [Chloroflexota bacterium]